MRRAAAGLLLTVLTFVALTARAGEREWREKKKAYDEALAAVEGDRGRDPKVTEKAVVALRASADALLGESEQKAVEHLLEHGLSSSKRPAVEIAYDVLQRVREAKGTKELVKAYEGADGRTKLVLARALRGNPAADVTEAFVKALRDRDAAIRANAASALGSRGAEALGPGQGALQKALKDDSMGVRWAAARSLETLTGARPDGFAEPQATGTGLLDRYAPYDRVALLFDVNLAAAETAFGDVFAADAAAADAAAQPAAPDGAAPPDGDGAAPPAPGGGRRRRGQDEPPAKPEPPKPVSAHDLAVRATRDMLEGLGEETGVHLVRFAGPGSARSYAEGFAPLATDKSRADALAWLGRAPAERGRDVLGAMRRVLEMTPPPQAVHVFLCGGPDGRGAATTEELKEGLAALVWGRDVTVSVTAFVIPPAQEPTNEAGRQARSEAEGAYGAFVDALAQTGSGRAVRVSLSRPSPEPTTPAGPAKPEEKFPVDLTKPVATRDVTTVRTALRAAVERADASAETFVEEVATCPDKKLTPLALDALRTGGHGIQQAAVRGLAKNVEPSVQEAVLEALQAERDPGIQLLLVRACGRSGAPTVTAGLVDALATLAPDPARVAWSLLAQRPATELQPQQGRLARAARGLTGLADLYARTALALAGGAQPPSVAGLDATEATFLPERFVAGGVALLVDTHRDMDAVFYTPPAPPPPATTTEQGGRRPPRGRAEPEAPKPAPPVSRLGAVAKELERALKALSLAGARANVITMAGRTWQPTAQTLDDRQRDAAVAFAKDLSSTTTRDVWKALKLALEDPQVEVVYLLVCGTPLRSPGSGDPAELLRNVRALNRDRAVAIHVVYVLGPVGGVEGGPESAARSDQLTALDAVYRTLSEESGGRLLIRETLPSLQVAPVAAPSGR